MWLERSESFEITKARSFFRDIRVMQIGSVRNAHPCGERMNVERSHQPGLAFSLQRPVSPFFITFSVDIHAFSLFPRCIHRFHCRELPTAQPPGPRLILCLRRL